MCNYYCWYLVFEFNICVGLELGTRSLNVEERCVDIKLIVIIKIKIK